MYIAVVEGETRYSPCCGIAVISGRPPFSRKGWALRFVTTSKHEASETSGFGLMVIIIGLDVAVQAGVVAEVVAVRLS